MWMNLESRSRSLSSLFSIATCFKASCADEPSFSHLFSACSRRNRIVWTPLHGVDESQLCLSTVPTVPSHAIADHQKDFLPTQSRAQVPRTPFSLLFCKLGLDVFTKVPNVNLALNSKFFVFSSHQCLDSGMSICTHQIYGNSTLVRSRDNVGSLVSSLPGNFKIHNLFGFLVHHAICAILGTASRRVTVPVANKSYLCSVQEISED